MKPDWKNSAWKLLVPAIAAVCFVVLLNTNQAANEEKSVLRHVVLLKFKADATPAQIQTVVDGFRDLPKQIKEIHAFEYGTDVSPEGLAKGFTHCFFVTFKTEQDRDAYLPHAAHQAFVAKLKPVMDDVTVIDYWTKD